MKPEPERLTPAQYKAALDFYAQQVEVDHNEVAAWTGISRALARKAYLKGFPGNKKTGLGALPPIRDVLEQQKFGAKALRQRIVEGLDKTQREELERAIMDGTVQRALEGVVSRTFLDVIREQAAATMQLIQASKPLVERIASQLQTLASVKNSRLTILEVQGHLAFVQNYVKDSVGAYEKYVQIEKTRVGHLPVNPEEQAAKQQRSTEDMLSDLLDMMTSVKNLDAKRPAKTITVESTPVALLEPETRKAPVEPPAITPDNAVLDDF